MKESVKNGLWIFLASVLIAAFFIMGGCSQKTEVLPNENSTTPVSTATAVQEEKQEATENIDAVADSNKSNSPNNDQEDQGVAVEKELTCEITISCETLASNPEVLPAGKRQLIPPDGIILAATKVSFEQGESAFDILARATKDNGIHMEFTKTPIYNSAYIEGIHNIYEFDCGEGSGWMYSVNGAFPQKGASTYILAPNDRVRWVYSCDMGKDVGGNSVNQKDE